MVKAEDFRWVRVSNKDELEAFYRGVLPNIIVEARAHGYAIGVHGSMRRDLDLIAVPWVDDHSNKDELAHVIQEAALGPPQAAFQWVTKPCGRTAVSFPVVWTELSAIFKNEPNLGHIDLSVMGAAIDAAERKYRVLKNPDKPLGEIDGAMLAGTKTQCASCDCEEVTIYGLIGHRCKRLPGCKYDVARRLRREK